VPVKSFTLVTKRLYFGVDALRLRDATERVLLRVQGLPPERARINADALAQDFGWSPGISETMIDQLVQGGLLQRLSPHAREFGITDKFRRCASARIVDPLPRQRAQMLLTHLADLAVNFNRTGTRNKYEIDSIAVHGQYLDGDDNLTELAIGVTGRRRPPAERPLIGRATVPTEGTAEIRAMLQAPSGFITVSFVQKLADLPRPFTVVFKADGT
jgi:hypothetical protein